MFLRNVVGGAGKMWWGGTRKVVEQLHGIGTKREFPHRHFEDEIAGVHTDLTKVTNADRVPTI